MDSLQYKSFLLRLWRETNDQSPQANWELEIEHIQSGEKWDFGTLDEMVQFLQGEMNELKSPGDV
jgi:hypothetical protein